MEHFSEYKPVRFETYEFKNKKYADVILTLDTETTTFFYYQNKWVVQGEINPELLSECSKYSLVYIWTFSINDRVFYGREISDFFGFLLKICDANRGINFIIYVHNLGYDFSFLYEHIVKIDTPKCFARAMYKPMYIKLPHRNIEFRCSYMLTNMGLDNCAKNFKLPVKKQKNSLIYGKARTPVTPLTDEEMKYCEYDCLVLYTMIKDVFLQRYKNIADIPITQTGEIRRVFKSMCNSERFYMKNVQKMHYDFEMYKILTRVIQGGYTHLNPLYMGDILHNIASFDISSSYPTEMCTRKFPMSSFKRVDRYLPRENNAHIMYVRFTDIRQKGAWAYIARHKADIARGKFNPITKRIDPAKCDNGKISEAEIIEMWVTDVDYNVIIENYDFAQVEFLKIYRAYSDYLPKFMVEYILDLYVGKTSLKHNDEFYAKYCRDKQQLNSCFGMCCTNNIVDEVILDIVNLGWAVQDLSDNEIIDKIANERPFLNFAWGIYVTAWARFDLWQIIKKIGLDCVYCDTDSAKILNAENYKKIFDDYNSKVDERVETVCRKYRIDISKFRPKSIEGVVYPLGHFCYEHTYTCFKSLGSKKYCYVRADNNEFDFVVAGLKKEYQTSDGKSQRTISTIDDFDFGKKIPFGRVVHWHNPGGEIPKELIDYLGNVYIPKTKSGITMLNTYYSFLDNTKSVKEYKKYVLDVRNKYRDYFRLV